MTFGQTMVSTPERKICLKNTTFLRLTHSNMTHYPFQFVEKVHIYYYCSFRFSPTKDPKIFTPVMSYYFARKISGDQKFIDRSKLGINYLRETFYQHFF